MGSDLGKGVAGFLDTLASDETMQALWEREPVAEMEKFGLSEQDQVLILNGSISDVRVKILGELEELPEKPEFVCIIIKSPGPGPTPGGGGGGGR